MASQEIDDFTALTTPASGDLLPIVDVSDTTDSPQGTTKKIAVSDLVSGGVVPDDSVTNAKLANMAQATIKGRASGAGTGDPTDLTGTQATVILDNMVGDSGSGGTKGLVPAPGAGDAAANKFLKANGGWAVPSGTGIGGSTGSTDNALLRADGTGGSTVQSSAITVDDNGATTVPEISAPSTPASGKVAIYAKSDHKLYIKDQTGAETDLTGTAPSGSAGGALSGTYPNPSVKVSICIACSDESTALTTGTAKVTFRMPHAMTLTDIRASLTAAQASGSIFTVDVNEGGTTILSTKITIDNTEKTSTTAAAAPVISDASLADDAEITIDIDQIGASGATGLKVYLIGTRS